ncbi:MAG: glycosyltransferase [Elusimicrobiota bacterium]
MPKVLRLLNRFNLGGPTHNAAYLSKHMAPEFETLLVAGAKDDSEGSSEYIVRAMGLKPLLIPEMKRELNLFSDIQAYRRIKQLIREFKPDIVHTHAAKAGALGRLAARECGVPIIVHTFHGHVFHSYFSPLKSRLFIEIERYLARLSSAIIVLSELQKHDICSTFEICASDKIAEIHVAIELNKFQEDRARRRAVFRSEYGLDEDEIAIGIIGRLVPVKNHALFLRAFKSALCRTDKRLRAFIIGDGECRDDLTNLAAELGIDFGDAGDDDRKAQLTFTSWIKDVSHVYAGLDIVALTSLNEGTPVSLIEAQAASLPIVTTRVGGVEDVVVQDETALLSESGDADTFARNLVQLAEDTELRRRLGRNGWDHVREKFSCERLVNNVTDLYRRLLSEATGNGAASRTP